MPTTTTRLGIPIPGPGDAFKPVSVDLPALGNRMEAVAVQYRSTLAATQVRDVGEVGQIRAGRPFAPTDFTAMGLATPVAIWNLSNVNDTSGNARNLTNKGAVPFGTGITGVATESAVFSGSTAQALYIADTGAADPFRIRTGSWGCWFRTAKRGTEQGLVAKYRIGASLVSYLLMAASTNLTAVITSTDGTATPTLTGTTDVCDDRWHFAVATHDGSRVRLYVDGVLEASALQSGTLFPAAVATTVGGYGADATTATTSPSYGRVDAAFLTSDVLSDDQVRNLYCARLTHTLANGAGAAVAPTGARLAVRRRKRGGVLVGGDFPATPVRLYNFTAGALTDSGTNNVPLTINAGTGAIVTTAGADGVRDGGYSFSGAHTGMSATDAGLPAALTARTYGGWFKGAGAANVGTLMGWGTTSTADARLVIVNASGTAPSLAAFSGADQIAGPNVIDGLWHHVVIVEDNAAADGVKRKLYIDGRLVGGSTVMNSLTLAGANALRVAANPNGTSPWTGQVARAAVLAVALTAEQIRSLYNVGSQALAASPKPEGDHVETLEATGLLVTFDALEGCDQVDLSVLG